jgi:hypothetical protein
MDKVCAEMGLCYLPFTARARLLNFDSKSEGSSHAEFYTVGKHSVSSLRVDESPKNVTVP